MQKVPSSENSLISKENHGKIKEIKQPCDCKSAA